MTPATLAEFYRRNAPRNGGPDPDGRTPSAPVDQTGPGSTGTDDARTDDGRPDAATLDALRAIIAEADAMRGAYFFTPPASAGARRTYERQHTHPRVTWTDGGRTYTAEYSTRATCRNVYAVGTYTRDGQRVYIIRTDRGAPMITGSATITGAQLVPYSARNLRNRAKITGTRYDIAPGGAKWFYRLEDAEPMPAPIPVPSARENHGRAWTAWKE